MFGVSCLFVFWLFCLLVLGFVCLLEFLGFFWLVFMFVRIIKHFYSLLLGNLSPCNHQRGVPLSLPLMGLVLKKAVKKPSLATPCFQPVFRALRCSCFSPCAPAATCRPPPGPCASWSQDHSRSPPWSLGFGGFLSQGAQLPPCFLALQVGGGKRALPDPTSAFSVPPSPSLPRINPKNLLAAPCLTLV